MRAFPRLSLIYSEWQKKIESTGAVQILTSHEVTSIDRSIPGVGARIKYRKTGGIDLAQDTVPLVGAKEVEEDFDELVLACDANIALKLLESGGKGATSMEKRVLGNVKVGSGF